MSTPLERSVTVSGIQVHVREVGQGPPLLLINGLASHTAMWEPLEHTLAGFRIVEFDLPGAGRSDVPWRPVSVRKLARIATAVLDQADMPKADVLGYSMGGIVAQQLAADHPSRVRRLVLVATTPGVGAVQGELKALLNIVTPVRYLSPKAYERTIGSLVGGRARHDRAWVAEQGLLRLQHAPSWRGYMGQLASISRWSGMPILQKVQQPTLVVAGDDDPLTPLVNALMLTHLLPHGRIMVCPGEGHLIPLDSQSAAHPGLRDFLCAKDLGHSDAWQHAEQVSLEDVRRELRRMRYRIPPWSTANKRMRRRYLRPAVRSASPKTSEA